MTSLERRLDKVEVAKARIREYTLDDKTKAMITWFFEYVISMVCEPCTERTGDEFAIHCLTVWDCHETAFHCQRFADTLLVHAQNEDDETTRRAFLKLHTMVIGFIDGSIFEKYQRGLLK